MAGLVMWLVSWEVPRRYSFTTTTTTRNFMKFMKLEKVKFLFLKNLLKASLKSNILSLKKKIIKNFTKF